MKTENMKTDTNINKKLKIKKNLFINKNNSQW